MQGSLKYVILVPVASPGLATGLKHRLQRSVDRMTSIGHIVVRVYENGEKYQVLVMQNDDPTYPIIYKSPIKESR